MTAVKKQLGKVRLQPVGLVEQILNILGNAILQGELKGGEQLIESELKDHFGISRTPLREAFRELEQKDLVVIVPRKGTFVKNFGFKDINNYYSVLSVLEGHAAKEAHRKLSAEDVEEMEHELTIMARLAKEKNNKAFVEHHKLFHNVFIEASGNEILIKLIHNLRPQGDRYRYFYNRTLTYFKGSLEVHRRILNLFKEDNVDSEAVAKAVREHIEAFTERRKWNL